MTKLEWLKEQFPDLVIEERALKTVAPIPVSYYRVYNDRLNWMAMFPYECIAPLDTELAERLKEITQRCYLKEIHTIKFMEYITEKYPVEKK